MGWFDFLKNNKKEETEQPAGNLNPMLDKIEIKPGTTIARAFANEWETIAQAKLSYVSIKATPMETMKLEQSKFGHYPKLPAGFAYPKDEAGNYLYPLAQINFKEVPALPGYPSSGLLQFYISIHDDVFGIDFKDNQRQKNFRVLYFEEHEVEHHQTDFSFLQEVMKMDNSPVYKPHALNFSMAEEYIGLGDVHYENNAAKIVQQIADKYPAIKEDLEESLYDEFSSGGHKIGGYAFFTQEDPRSYDDIKQYYILLLQIDTDDEIMWGDSGVANFFIHPNDLARKDFSKVVYNWDCC